MSPFLNVRLADVQLSDAIGDGLTVGTDFNHSNVSVAGGGSDLSAGSSESSPVAGSDCGIVSYGIKISLFAGLIHEAVAGLGNTGLNENSGLAGRSTSSQHVQGLKDSLRTVVVDCVSLFIQDEAVVDDAGLNEPTRNPYGVVVTIMLS